MDDEHVKVVRIAAFTPVSAAAGAIAGFVRSGQTQIQIRAIGASATNQAVKSIALARRFLNVMPPSTAENQHIYDLAAYLELVEIPGSRTADSILAVQFVLVASELS